MSTISSKYQIITGLLFIILINTIAAQGHNETKSICAIRVEFVEDENSLTTGNGKFMIDTVTVDSFAIDPAPHDKPYFEDHLTAVSNYYKNVSQNRLSLNGQVYPADRDSAYQLANKMGYYNPNTSDEQINLGLSRLFFDAVTEADKDDALQINDYNLIVIFHAGVGKDVSLDYDETPQDISSLFITIDFLRESFGADFDGVPVKNGIVTQGIILPETENQQNIQIALNGIFASNVGSFLGLYDLFSPTKQRSGIGRFGLMDFGLMNMNGLVPSAPCAFSREKLGWDEPLILDKPLNGIEIKRFDPQNSELEKTLYRVPINHNEYFLIEYRGDSKVNIDSEYVELSEGRDQWPSYLELLKTYHADKIEISQNGVLLSVTDYDLGIGGAGVLIWHIDESVIAARMGNNAINDDPSHRAVDLEEADGSQDIGHIYNLLDAGFQKDLGWFADFWYSNRPADLEEFELYQNKFSPQTRPNSLANLNRSNSHITINNFSGNLSDIMTFDFERGKLENGYPLTLYNGKSQIQNIIYGEVAGHSANYIFTVNDRGEIFAVSDSGNGLYFDEKILFAQMDSLTAPAQISLALADTNSDHIYDILAAADNERLFAYHLNRVNADSLATPVFSTIELSNDRITPLVIRNSDIFVGCSNGFVYRYSGGGILTESIGQLPNSYDLVLSAQGELNPTPPQSLFAAKTPGADRQDRIISWNAEDYGFLIGKKDDGLDKWQYNPTADRPQGPFSVADVDFNGVYDFVFCGVDKVYAYNQDGALINGFPIKPVLTSGDQLIGTPLILDVNDDHALDIVVGTKMGQILTLPLNGKIISEFPLSTGGLLTATPVIGNFDQDASLELAAITADGALYMWEINASETGDMLYWLQSRKNAANNKLIQTQITYRPVGSGLMPANRVFNYPNPNKESFTTIRYYLNAAATVHIKIFDTAGTLVKEMNGPGQERTDNEVRWDVSGIASGVYLCRVEAKSANSSDSKIIKIMVVH